MSALGRGGISSLPMEHMENYRAVLLRRWPGVRINRMEIAVAKFAPGWEFSWTISMRVSLSGPEPLLIDLGLVTQEDLDSVPQCGTGCRRARDIARGKTRTRVEFHWCDSPYRHDDDCDIEGIFAEMFAPLWYRPPQAA